MESTPLILGIDPGAHGALASGLLTEGPFIETFHGNDAHDLLLGAVIGAKARGHHIVAYLEKVGGFIGHPQTGAAMLKFGEGFGYLNG